MYLLKILQQSYQNENQGLSPAVISPVPNKQDQYLHIPKKTNNLKMKNYSEILKKYRFDNHLTQLELSHKLKVSYMTIFRWEKGISVPNETCKEKIDLMFISTKLDSNGDILNALNEIQTELSRLTISIDTLKTWLTT